MPKIAEKQTVLNGRGSVVRFASGTSVGNYVYREWDNSIRNYRTKHILEAKSLEEAIAMAPQIAIELAQDLANKPRNPINIDPLNLIAREEKLQRDKEKLFRAEQKKDSPKMTIEKAMDDWLKQQLKRVDAGAFSINSYEHKKNCSKKIRGYLNWKKITMTSQINETSFDDYCIYRLKDTDKRILIQRELSILGEFIKSYLVKYKYIPARLWLDGQFLPKIEVRQSDRDANPAINSEDWDTIINHVRNIWRKEAYENKKLPSSNQFRGEVKVVDRKTTKRSIWFRNMFWHWILVAKNSGMSPEEICKLKWKNVEIVDVGRVSNTKAQEEWEQVMGEAQADGIEQELSF